MRRKRERGEEKHEEEEQEGGRLFARFGRAGLLRLLFGRERVLPDGVPHRRVGRESELFWELARLL